MTVITLLMMVLMHIIEDFHLQGKMGDMKQKMWWEAKSWESVQELTFMNDRLDQHKRNLEKYGRDYIPVLLLHGFEWSMFIHMPILAARVIADGWAFSDVFLVLFTASVLVHAAVHVIVDHQKANRLLINLIMDQTIHMLQIVVTYVIFCMIL